MNIKSKSPLLALFLLATLLPASFTQAMGPRQSAPAPTLTQSHTWHDGERERAVWMNPALVAEFNVSERNAEQVQRTTPGARALPNARGGARIWQLGGANSDHALRSLRAAQPTGRYSPVFHDGPNEGGRMRALPGNVIVYFRPEWDEAQVRSWASGRSLEIVRKLEIGKNAYVIRTEPGLASLETANTLRQSGEVLSATPDWWQDVRTR